MMIPIDSIKNLQKIGNAPEYPPNGNYKLTCDIDASETRGWNRGKGFKSITNFGGVFDGNGHVISNLYIKRKKENYVGLFGQIVGKGVVRNLGVEDADILGYKAVGIITGENYSGSVKKCYSTGIVRGDSIVGGLVGLNLGKVEQCYNTGILGCGSTLGGLVGANLGTVKQSYASTKVSGFYNVGGLIGENNEGVVKQCYACGRVDGLFSAGGLVGGYWEELWPDLDNTEGEKIYTNLKGIPYWESYESIVLKSYWDVITSRQRRSDGGQFRTTDQMMEKATYKGWDFVNIWDIQEGVTYPWLRALGPTKQPKNK
ncbi:MAG: hypothetical protein N3G21_13090 [Candidatus Hydrogenedentes bacterium]|nr:hypothetical protein [Candidatus Hydrogenedentota bacterium]